jgi:hypothetical protein
MRTVRNEMKRVTVERRTRVGICSHRMQGSQVTVPGSEGVDAAGGVGGDGKNEVAMGGAT